MAEQHIRNPIEWGWHQMKGAGHAVGSAAHAVEGGAEARNAPLAVRRITVADYELLRQIVADSSDPPV